MVQLDERPDVRTPNSVAAPPGVRPGRPVFEVFVAVLAAVALVVGLYAFGRAVDDDPAPDTITTAQDAAGVGEGAGAAAAGDAASAHGHDELQVDDRGFSALENGEQHGHYFTQPLTAEERTELARQLTLAREVALQYPTLADAEAAGMFRAGPFSPGLGTHMINIAAAGGDTDGVMSDDDIRSPIAYIYDGVEPTSKIAGLFYGTTVENAEGFAGPNDIWHQHSAICIVPREGGGIDTPLGADRDATQEDCDKVGGNLIERTQYLLHVWPVPGYESPEGVFSHLSSAVTCPDGTYHTIPDVTQVGTRNSICLNP